MDVRHQTALAINTVLSSLALFLVLIPTFTLRGRFLKVVDTIPAFNVDLQPRMGGAFAQLYACAILGGLIVLQSMILVSEDLRHPWWVCKSFLSLPLCCPVPCAEPKSPPPTRTVMVYAIYSVQHQMDESIPDKSAWNRFHGPPTITPPAGSTRSSCTG